MEKVEIKREPESTRSTQTEDWDDRPTTNICQNQKIGTEMPMNLRIHLKESCERCPACGGRPLRCTCSN